MAGLLGASTTAGATAGVAVGAAVVGLVADDAKGFTGATERRLPPASGFTGTDPELRVGTSDGADAAGRGGPPARGLLAGATDDGLAGGADDCGIEGALNGFTGGADEAGFAGGMGVAAGAPAAGFGGGVGCTFASSA